MRIADSYRELSVFGSVLTDRFNDESDIDFVVDFEAVDIAEYADNYLEMQSSLSQLLGREIDPLEDKLSLKVTPMLFH